MRYTGPKCRQCRQEGEKLFLKGEKCQTAKCPIERRSGIKPGQHGQKRHHKPSDFGIRLREKQKVKKIFGAAERTFKNYYVKALSFKGETGKRLLQLLETRLDNIVFRSGLADSRSIARQLINHGFCTVDGKRVNIPSYQVKIGQIISYNSKGLSLAILKKTLEKKNVIPNWLQKKAVVVKLVRLPERDEMEPNIDEQLIIEYYSK